MLRFTPNQTKLVLLAFYMLIKLQSTVAQTNLVSNAGFQSSTSAVTNWTTTNLAGTSGISTAEGRTGGNAFTSNNSSTTTTGYVESNSAISVPNNQYLILMAYYKVSSRASNSNVQIGITGNMGSTSTPAAASTYYKLSRTIQNTTGSTASWKVRINMYSNAGTNSRNWYWDDVIAYVSSSSIIDVTKPDAPTNISANYTSTSATLNWTAGADNVGGTGVKRSVILRSTGTCPATAPVLNDQAVYSKSGGYGVSTVGTWTVLDTVNQSTSTYTDNTILAGTSYVYAIVHEDLAYNHSVGTLAYVPVSATTLPINPTNAQNGVSTSSLALSWPVVCGASSYNVYLSSNQTDVNNLASGALVSTTQSTNTYNVNSILSGTTTYYWKVVPKNAAGNAATGCPTWSFTTTVQALAFDITRSSSTTYSSILNSGNSFSWSGTYNADDKMSDALDFNAIGFSGFSYQGNPVTALKVNSNGFITFNLSSTASYTNNFSSQTQLVAPFWEDLVCQGYISGSAQSLQLSQLQNTMKYLVTGSQGNQVLTIEWSEMELYNNSGPSINFQVKLYEQGNKIEFIYGKMYGFIGTQDYTYTYTSGLSGSTVAGTPTAGQLVALQVPNVLNYNNTLTNNLSELPDCYSSVLFAPASSFVTYTASARTISNDECATATVLPIQYGLQNDFCSVYSSKGATASPSIPVCNASSAGVADDDVWFKFTVTTTGNYAITVNGSGGYNPVVQLFSGNCTSLTAISCANATGNGLIETLTANSLVEGTYFLRIYDANTGTGGSGNFVVSVYNLVTPPANDNCSGATTIAIGSTISSGSTTNATASGVTNTCTGTADDDVWFKFTATSAITRISVDGGTAYNAVVQYFSGNCSALTSMGCVSTTGAAGEESVYVTTTVGNTYFIRVYHSANGATPPTGFDISVSNAIPNCPVLSTPANATNTINRTTTQTFSWTASTLPTVGTKTYTVQIATDPLFNNLVTLTGATGITTTSYTLAANVLAANTQYFWRVLAVNTNGSSAGCSYNAFATTTTGVPSCASGFVPSVSATNTSNTPILSWVAGSGSPTSYDVYLSNNQSSVSSLSSSVRVTTGITSTSFVPSALSNNTTYYWLVIPKNTSGSASGCFVSSFTTIVASPANDDCSGATTLSSTSSTPVRGTTLNATESMPGNVGVADDDVWYKFTAVKSTHNILISPVYSFNAVVELFSGNCSSLTSLSVVNTNGNGEIENISATGLTVGQTYYVRVYDFGATSTSLPVFDISINEIDLGISSFVSPSNNNCGNTTVSVSLKNFSVSDIDFSLNPVTISGSVLSPANTRTNFSNVLVNSGTLASGASTNLVLTNNYSVVDAGSYTYTATATVANDNNPTNNSITSRLQQIELPAPFILTGTGSYCAGGSGVVFTLSGSATGVNYQLYRSTTSASSVISGTGSSLIFNNVSVDGAYRVVATSLSSSCQSYMSASAVVTVSPLWLGYSSNWNDPANWCNNTIPASNANIVISGSAAFMPALPGNIIVNNLELSESNKRVDLNGNTLTINGAISGSGVIRGTTTSSIVVNGSGNMGALMLDQTTDGTTNALRNLTVNVGTGTIADSLSLGSKLNLTGTLYLNNGKLNTNGNLVLVSNSTETARIAAIASTADISGNVTSQRYVPPVVRRYRMISPNTTGFTFSDLKDDIFVTGTGGATNGFDAASPNSASVYTYQESTTGTRGWKAVTTINQTLASGRGVIAYVRGDRTLPSPQWYTPPYVAQNAVTIDFVGPVNKGTVSPTITYTNTGFPENDGFNLVGNPYPSQIDWTLVTKSNINPFVYTLNPQTNGYVANDGTNIIASGQAFFIQANAANPSITFTESCKVAGGAVALFKNNVAPFTINMILDSVNSDLAQLRFNVLATDSFNAMEDALKFSNSSINMGFVVGNKDVQINTIPALTHTTDTFVLFANAPANTYRMAFSNFDEIPSTKSILLLDLFANTVTDLRVNNVYTFAITSNALSQGKRFRLVITNQGVLPVEFVNVKAAVACNQSDIEVSWTTATEVNNEKFVIEQSYDNKNFKAVGSVKGAVNSKIKTSYTFANLYAASEAIEAKVTKVYYRIRQLDLSGESKVSKTVVVNLLAEILNINATQLSVYPNPAKAIVQVKSSSADGLGKVLICDITGKVVIELFETSNLLTVDVTILNKGIYFIKCQNFSTQKILIE